MIAHLCFGLFQGWGEGMSFKLQEYAALLTQKVPQANPDVQEPALVAAVPLSAGVVVFEFGCRRAIGWSEIGLGGRIFE